MSEEATNGQRASNEGGPSDERDRTDMARLAAGKNAALNNLMERHAAKLFNYLVRSLQNEEDAADLTQETFVRVFQHCAKFDTKQRFLTWLYAIATNLVKDCYRHRARHALLSLDAVNETTGGGFLESLPDQKVTPSESLQKMERAEAVRHAVSQLPEELRVPLILSEYEELFQAEIGVILNCSPKAVESRIYRARKQLRDKLGWLLESSA